MTERTHSRRSGGHNGAAGRSPSSRPSSSNGSASKGSSRRGGSGGRGRKAARNDSRTTRKTPRGSAQPLTPILDPPDIEAFTEFDLGDEVQSAIAAMGITKPTPIQALAIQPVLDGKDVIAKAETGTGKTLAFGAPMMAKIEGGRASVLGLVLSPTRELAEQVHSVLEKLGEARGVKTALIVGGEPLGPQVKALQAGAQVVVGTPGRVLDLMNQRFLQFPWTEFAILDEADKMLEIGFIDDVKKILDACNEYRRTLLFSATFPPPLLELARGYTKDPVEIATASGVATVDTIDQYFLRCSEDDRARNLSHLIEDSGPDDVFLVFCERRTDVDRLMRKLERKRFSVKALHGGYDQAARFKVMSAFRTGDVKCLVATDVASRGLDVAHVTHVVNLGVPRDVSDYTHRIGRTGRAGRSGTAVTFVSRRDERDWSNMQRQSGFDLTEIDRPRDLFKPKRRRRRDEDTDERTEERPRRSKRRERDERGDREERPKRRERKGRDERDERKGRDERKPRNGRKRRTEETAEERPVEVTEERPAKRRRSEERSEDRPRTAEPSGDGFGVGLVRDRADESAPAARKKGKRRPRKDEKSDGKDRDKRPKRKPRGETTRRDEAPARTDGFGQGV